MVITALIATSLVCADELETPTQTVNYCMPKSESDLSLEGFQLELPIESARGINRFGAPNVETILSNGPTANRVDIVFVGDGFTEADLPSWPAVAAACRAGPTTIGDHQVPATVWPPAPAVAATE